MADSTVGSGSYFGLSLPCNFLLEVVYKFLYEAGLPLIYLSSAVNPRPLCLRTPALPAWSHSVTKGLGAMTSQMVHMFLQRN